MFSTDNNVETIGRLVEVLKNYIGLQTEYVKLDVIEKIVRLITALTLTVILSVSILMIAIFLSFAGVYLLESCVGIVWAFCIVAMFYFIVFLFMFAFRKQWIERPVVRLLASILMEK